MRRLFKVLWIVIICLVLAVPIGCSKKENAGPPPIPEVAVVTIQPQRLVITTELTGRASANKIAEVRPQVGGIIQKRLFEEGAEVSAGQKLYQIDPATYQAALDNAKAALGRSEANLPALKVKAERIKELLAERAVSQQDYDDVSAALNQAEADTRYWKAMVETASINLKYTSITAPISGRIGRSEVTEGALVTANQPSALAVIQKLDPMYVDVPQSTTELLQLRNRLEQGHLSRNGRNRVRIFLEDGTAYSHTGVLQFRDISVDRTTGSVMLRVTVPNPKGILLPGMFVRAVVEEGINPAAILVPQQGVSRTPKGEPYVFIVDQEGMVQQRMLSLDRAVGDAWLTASGLSGGERVIVEGHQRIRPGAPVKVVPFNPNAGDRQQAAATPDRSK